MVTGLKGAGLSTHQIADAFVAGDVVLFPKFQMLVGNAESLERLTDEQRAAFDTIVAEVHRLALGRQFTEAELAAEICELGGTVTEAGPEAREALRSAAAPLLDEMAASHAMGDIIGRISELAAETPPDPGAGTCLPAASDEPEPAASAVARATSGADLAGYTGTELPPSGTYRAEMVSAEMEAAGAGANYAAINDGTWTWTFAGDTWQAAHDRNSERCSGTIEVVDGNVRFLTAVSQGCGMDYDVRWRLDGADLSLRLADLPWTYSSADFANEQTFIDRVWTRIEEAGDPSPVALPAGTFRAEIAVEDLESKGARHEQAIWNAGIITWVLEEPGGSMSMASDIGSWECPYVLTRDGEIVTLDMPSSSDCDPGVYSMTLETDGDLLVPTVVSVVPASDDALVRAMFERAWTRID